MLFVNLNKAFNAFLHLSTQVPDHVPGGSAGVTLLPAVCEDQASLGSGAATGVCVRVQENTEWPPLAGGGGGGQPIREQHSLSWMQQCSLSL